MNRDASPTRTIETEQTLFRVSVKDQRRSQRNLLYFCACLDCDVPIIEALFHTKTIRISPKGSNFKQRLIVALWEHLRRSYPNWGSNIIRPKGIFAPLPDRRQLRIIEDELPLVLLRGLGSFPSEFGLGIYVVDQEIRFSTGNMGCNPTVGKFFSLLDSCLKTLLETLNK